MSWFKRHLNWTWVLAYLLSSGIANTFWIIYPIFLFMPFIGLLIVLICCVLLYWFVSFWFLHRKGRSVWWLLLLFVWSPLWLVVVAPSLTKLFSIDVNIVAHNPYIMPSILILGVLFWIPLLLRNNSKTINKPSESDLKLD
jgi:hypothetical protein